MDKNFVLMSVEKPENSGNENNCRSMGLCEILDKLKYEYAIGHGRDEDNCDTVFFIKIEEDDNEEKIRMIAHDFALKSIVVYKQNEGTYYYNFKPEMPFLYSKSGVIKTLIPKFNSIPNDPDYYLYFSGKGYLDFEEKD